MTLKPLAWLCIIGFFLVATAGVLLRPLTAIDETRYVAVAWEMWQSGDYLLPTRNFELYTHKPPLLFWSINLIWAVTGVSETAARLVGPLYAALALVLTGMLGARLWRDDPDAGPRAIIVLSGMLSFVVMGGLTMFDAMLTATTLAGLLALLSAVETKAPRWWMALGAAIAFGVLSKGPVILVHLGPALVLAPIWSRGRGDIGWRQMLTGFAIAVGSSLVVLGFWLIPAIVTGGQEYREAILWTQTAGRISSSFAHDRPFWFFGGLLPIVMFPWVFIPAVWRAGMTAKWREPGLALCAIWAVSGFVLFSMISGKQAHYILPEMAAAALIISRLLRGQVNFRPVFPALLLVLVAVVSIAASAGLVPLGDLGRILKPTTMLFSWGLVMLALCWLGLQSGGLRGSVMLTLGTVLALNLLIGLTAVRSEFDSHPIALTLAPYQSEGIAFVNGTYNAEFNFAGRFTRSVATPGTPEALAIWQDQHPGGVIVGRAGQGAPPWKADKVISFRNIPYGIWHVADAPKAVPSS